MPGSRRLGVAGQACRGYGREHGRDEAVAARGHPGRGIRPLRLGQPQRCRERDGSGHVLGAAAAFALLTATVEHGFERDASAHDEGADALGSADLVAGQREGVDAELVDAQGEPSGSLHGIGVERDPARRCHGGQLG